jgi:3-dehydroquinate dehydratase II
MKILVMHGPNLDRLGQREPEVYGHATLELINQRLQAAATAAGVEVDCFQSNDEGALVSRLWQAVGTFDGVIFNPAAYTHTSVALHDAIKGCGLPCVEVHLSNTHTREAFRHTSLTVSACIGQIMGFGAAGYLLALQGLVDYLKGGEA